MGVVLCTSSAKRVVFTIILFMTVVTFTVSFVYVSQYYELVPSSTHNITRNNIIKQRNYTASRPTPRSALWNDFGNVTSCTTVKVKNVAFIKTHKTGSSTLAHVINMFGYRNNLSFVLGKNSSINGHVGVVNRIFGDMAKYSFLPPVHGAVGDYDNYKYNLVAIHIRYFRSAFDSFMEPGTKYITILRDPTTQFESAFVAFQFWKSLPREQQIVPMRERLEYFFLHPDYNREKFKQVVWPLTNRLGTGWYYAKNDQIFDLGLDHKFHDNKTTVEQYINRLDDELDLVLILEHIDESLVILRKELCWSWNDILYMAKNVRAKYVAPLSDTLAEKIREWNSVDVLLYSHFNRTLWKKIANYGSRLSFQSDLELFRKMLKQVNNQCANSTSAAYDGNLSRNVAKGASIDCKHLTRDTYGLLKDIIHRQRQGRQRRIWWEKKVPHGPIIQQIN